ncbi:MAG: hypothetical protein ABIL74_08705, partial [candidate division WOR-3 bacterium]
LSEKRLRYLRAYRRGKVYKLQISAWYSKHPDYYKLCYRRRIQRDPDYFKRYREQHQKQLNEYWRRYRRKERLRKYMENVHNQKQGAENSESLDKIGHNGNDETE